MRATQPRVPWWRCWGPAGEEAGDTVSAGKMPLVAHTKMRG